MRWSEIKINQENAALMVQNLICTCCKEFVGSDLKQTGKSNLYHIMFGKIELNEVCVLTKTGSRVKIIQPVNYILDSMSHWS